MGATFWWQKYRTTYWFRPKWPITKHLCPYGNVLSISYLLLRQCRAGSKTFWPLPSPLKPGSSSSAPVEPAGLLRLHTLCLHVQSVEPAGAFPTLFQLDYLSALQAVHGWVQPWHTNLPCETWLGGSGLSFMCNAHVINHLSPTTLDEGIQVQLQNVK